jgi:hypothetical protein
LEHFSTGTGIPSTATTAVTVTTTSTIIMGAIITGLTHAII